MARPESRATAGYFPTPEHLIPSIASLMAIECGPIDRPVFFDPCAGTGDALVALAASILDLEPSAAARHCQAIELEATRAEQLQRRLPPGAAHRGDALTFGITAWPGASVLFLNPPSSEYAHVSIRNEPTGDAAHSREPGQRHGCFALTRRRTRTQASAHP